MLNASRQWLIKLLESGSLAASSVPNAAKAEIGNIQNVGFIAWDRSGAGAKYSVSDEKSILDMLAATGYSGNINKLTPKAKAVALHGDAHKGQDNSILLMLSATEEGAIWTNGTDKLDVFDYSSRFGVASLVVKKDDAWSTNKPIALIENLDLLIYAKEYFEKIDFVGTVLYYSGMISGKLLEWLNEKERASKYIMFPDYDLVGLNNYIRAKDSLGNILSMYVPSDLQRLIKEYGLKKTLANSQADRSKIEQTNYKDVADVYKMIIEEGKTLHQEGLMLTNT